MPRRVPTRTWPRRPCSSRASAIPVWTPPPTWRAWRRWATSRRTAWPQPSGPAAGRSTPSTSSSSMIRASRETPATTTTRENSFLNQVLDRRTGIPITLAVVYIEVARRAGIRVDGVNFPGHFLLRFPCGPEEDHRSAVFVDPFHGGSILSEADCRSLLRRHAGDSVDFGPGLLAPATKQQILVRMLGNLKRLYVRMRSFPRPGDHRPPAGDQPLRPPRAARPRAAVVSRQRLRRRRARSGSVPAVLVARQGRERREP